MNAVSSSKPGGTAPFVRRHVVQLEARLRRLQRLRRRWRLQHAVGHRLLWGLLAGLAIMVAGRFVHALHHPYVVLGTLGACTGYLLLRAWGRTYSPFELALWVDERAGLDQRLSSAIAFAGDPAPTPMMEEAVEDAAQAVRTVGDEQATDGPPSRLWLLALLVALLLPALAMLPPPLSQEEVLVGRMGRAISQAGIGLQHASADLQRQLSEQATPDAQAAARSLGDTGQALQAGDGMTAEQALERIQQSREQVERALREDAARRLMAERLRQDERTREAGDALAAGDTQRARRELRDAAERLRQDDVQGKAGQDLADHLRDAARTQPPGPAQAAANRAAAAAAAGRLEETQDAMRNLADEMGDMTSLGEDRDVALTAADALRDARDQIGMAAAGEAAPAPGAAEQRTRRPGEADAGEAADAARARENAGAPGSRTGEADRSGGGADGAGGPGAEPAANLGAADESLTVSTDPGALMQMAGQMLEGERRASLRDNEGPTTDQAFAPVPPQAIRQMRQLGDDQLARQDIPPGYRMLVRDYFTALEAEAKESAAPTQ